MSPTDNKSTKSMTPAEVVTEVDGSKASTKQEAFQAVADATGRTKGSIAQTYYNAKKKASGEPRKKSVRPVSKRKDAGTKDALKALAQARRALDQAEAVIDMQAAELAELRKLKEAVDALGDSR